MNTSPMQVNREEGEVQVPKGGPKEEPSLLKDIEQRIRGKQKDIKEGSYAEYRCLECGSEWNCDEVQKAIDRIKSIQRSLKNGNRLMELQKLARENAHCVDGI